MRSRHRFLSAVIAGALVVASAAGQGAAAEPAVPVAAGTTGYGAVTSLGEITLVTGDTVSVGVEPSGQVTAEVTGQSARPDGRPVLYSTVREGDSLYVYPSDALAMVTAGRLDRRLFDVDYL